MNMANGWILVRPMSEKKKLIELARPFSRTDESGQIDAFIASLEKEVGYENQSKDLTLYIEFSDRKEGNLPKRPNDGTRRETVASGWFDEAPEMNQFASQPWYNYRDRIERVEVLHPWAPENAKYLFDGLTSCQEFNLLKLDTSQCTSFEGMFRGCSSVSQLFDLGRLDTSMVTDTSQMFMNCLALRTINISGWDVSNIRESSGMLSGCTTFVLANDSQEPFLDKVASKLGEGGIWRRTNQ